MKPAPPVTSTGDKSNSERDRRCGMPQFLIPCAAVSSSKAHAEAIKSFRKQSPALHGPIRSRRNGAPARSNRRQTKTKCEGLPLNPCLDWVMVCRFHATGLLAEGERRG